MTIFGIIWSIFLAAFIISTLVIFFGAPYVPTLRQRRRQALDMLALKEGQVLYDLGSGDGSLLVEAAGRGFRVVGYELNPFLVIIAWLRTRRYRRLVKIKWGNFWAADLSQADGVFVFLIDRFMPKLEKKLAKEAKPGLKVVSHAFKLPERKAAAAKNALFLYTFN